MSRVISFPIGLSPRTAQDLGFAFRGLAITKALLNCSSGSEGTNTNLPELVLPRSPLEVPRAAAAFLNWGPKGAGFEIRGGLAPGGGEGHARGARRPLSWEPLGSSPLAVQ